MIHLGTQEISETEIGFLKISEICIILRRFMLSYPGDEIILDILRQGKIDPRTKTRDAISVIQNMVNQE